MHRCGTTPVTSGVYLFSPLSLSASHLFYQLIGGNAAQVRGCF